MTARLRLKKGARVFTSDGKELGRVERVVIDPRGDEVTHLVIEKGLFLVKDKLLPVQLVKTATEDRIVLLEGSEELRALPDFEDVQYVLANPPNPGQRNRSPESYPSPMYWYPPIGTIWSGGGGYVADWRAYAYPSPPYVAHEAKNIPEGAVALEEGARVIGKEGERIGEVDEILTDPESEKVTHLVISRGLLNKRRKLVPVTWLGQVHQDEIHLVVSSQVVENLDEYRPDES
jgi:uncharacterized protein YrrD